jgi:hypothetical protein
MLERSWELLDLGLTLEIYTNIMVFAYNEPIAMVAAEVRTA